MKQLLVEIDDELAKQLQRVVRARSRGRSEFVRNAIRKALWVREEARTAAAYGAQPDSDDDAYVEPGAWEPGPAPRSGKKSVKR